MGTCPTWMPEPRDSEKRDTGPSEASPQVDRKGIHPDPEPGLGRKGAGSSSGTPPPRPSCQPQAWWDVQGRLCPALPS